MVVRIESHAGVTKLHPGRFLDQSEPAHVPLGKQASDGRVSSEKVKVGALAPFLVCNRTCCGPQHFSRL